MDIASNQDLRGISNFSGKSKSIFIRLFKSMERNHVLDMMQDGEGRFHVQAKNQSDTGRWDLIQLLLLFTEI